MDDTSEYEGESQTEVIEGTFPILNRLAQVLLDPGSSHSYIETHFVNESMVKAEKLPYVLEVGTPTTNIALRANTVYKDCRVDIQGENYPADVVTLRLQGYDAILGMDWLAKYDAQLNCREKIVTVRMPGKPKVKVKLKGRRAELPDS